MLSPQLRRSSPTNILFYSDAREYGGHEAMTVAAVRYMAGQPELNVIFIFYERNCRLGDELSKIATVGRLTLLPLQLKSEGFRPFRPVVQVIRMPHLERVMGCLDPVLIVVSHGNIEGSWLGLIAAKRAGFRTISYIPMAQPLRCATGFISLSRAFLDRMLYRVPDKFITITRSGREMLLERGAKAEIDVVLNGIELKQSFFDRASARREFGFAEEDYVVATIGRIVFGQKAQDFLVKSIVKYRQKLRTFRFCVVGEGPDEPKLRKMIGNFQLGEYVSVLPWRSDLSSFYSAIDLLAIPSHFEGVPLVMLEAMWHGIPIVASDVDGMAEVLPPEWLFRRGDHESLVNALLRVYQANNSQYLAANKGRVAEEFSLASFQRRFCKAVTGNLQVTVDSQSINTERVTHTCASELI